MNCKYCEENSKIHVDYVEILSALNGMDKTKRKTILQFIHKVNDDNFHTTIAVSVLKDTYCEFCGYINEREVDDDRYIYLCSNMKCEVWV
jgi:hypothetical protein